MGLLNSLLGGSEWRSKPPEEKTADISRYNATRGALEAVGRVTREECPAYYAANDAVWDAMQHVPWWRR